MNKNFKDLLVVLAVSVIAGFNWSNGNEAIVVGFIVALITMWKLEYNDNQYKD